MTPSSTVVVPWSPQPASEGLDGRQLERSAVTESGQGCGRRKRTGSTKRKWLVAVGIALAVAAAVFGSIWFGFAAVLPLLYVLPCLAMLAMCMKGMKGMKRSEESGG